MNQSKTCDTRWLNVTVAQLTPTQRWKMSNLLHGPISTNQILPREKARKLRHFWHFKPTKQNLWGFLWWINVDKLSIYGSLSIDGLFYANYFGLPNFLPQLPNFFTRIYPSYPWQFPTLISVLFYPLLNPLNLITLHEKIICWCLVCYLIVFKSPGFKTKSKEELFLRFPSIDTS